MTFYAQRTDVRRPPIVLAALLLAGLLAACAMPASPTPPTPTSASVLPSPTPQPTPTTEVTPTPTLTPTPTPPQELTICQGEEPHSLFVYDAYSRAALNVLAAIYEGPIGTQGYRLTPGILEQLPSFGNGDALVRIVEVQEGDTVVDMDGEVVELAPGVTLRSPAGDPVTFQSGTMRTIQTVVSFTLRADVLWADGEPVTAQDSQYSYEVAGTLADAALLRQISRTASYEAIDERTIVWTGLPGYRDTLYLLNFYHPLPRHTLGTMAGEELRHSDLAWRDPLGWGPFAIEEWVPGERIELLPNPHYFRAPEGLPHLDRLTFRFIPDSAQAIDELLSGGCDVLTPDLVGTMPRQPLLDAVEAGKARLASSMGNEWEHLDFGIQPAAGSAQIPFFAEAQVRQAIAHCIDRERIAAEASLYGAAVPAHSYVPPQHFLYSGDQLHTWPYDPAQGRTMLEEFGWRLTDGESMRRAHDIPQVASGTPFSVTLLTTAGDPARERTAEILRENLADCGVGMATRTLTPETFYADGPRGPVFGRQFDLALFSWLNGLDGPCEIYLSTQIPDEDNLWGAFNNPGYESPAFDRACQAGLEAMYGSQAHVRHHQEAQAIFSRDLPVLPLYFVPESLALRPEVRGMEMDPSQESVFWNIESFRWEW